MKTLLTSYSSLLFFTPLWCERVSLTRRRKNNQNEFFSSSQYDTSNRNWKNKKRLILIFCCSLYRAFVLSILTSFFLHFFISNCTMCYCVVIKLIKWEMWKSKLSRLNRLRKTFKTLSFRRLVLIKHSVILNYLVSKALFVNIQSLAKFWPKFIQTSYLELKNNLKYKNIFLPW